MSFDFAGKKILVTGAGKGIGRELTKTIVNAGGEVYALGRTKENVESLVQETTNVHSVIVDLHDWEATRREMEALEALDGVVNNAAAERTKSNALDCAKESIEKDIAVNLMAPINVIQVTAKKMIEAGKQGSIVNVSGLSGQRALKGNLGPGTMKAGLDMVTKQFALELGPHKIRVNSASFTLVLTEKNIKWLEKRPETKESFTSAIPQGKVLEVNDAVGTIMYLLSDHSSMVTGTLHTVDGGLLCHIPV